MAVIEHFRYGSRVFQRKLARPCYRAYLKTCRHGVLEHPTDGPRDLRVGPAGATRMACPEYIVMETEGRFLGLLEKVKEFRFVLGRLALLYQEGDIPDALLFTPSRISE